MKTITNSVRITGYQHKLKISSKDKRDVIIKFKIYMINDLYINYKEFY